MRLKTMVEGKLKLTVRYITDRQDLLEHVEDKLNGKLPLMLDRVDMFWVNVKLGTVDLGDACIDPDLKKPENFYVSRNYVEVDGESWGRLSKAIEIWFKKQPEYKQQIEWVKKLIAGGYPSVRAFGGTTCPICKHYFLVQKKHLHRQYEDKIYPFHSSMHLAGKQQMLDEEGRVID